MKLKILASVVLCLISNTLVQSQKLSDKEKLVTTAKVWGFLKYYHPNVSNGSYDWDDELLNIMPKLSQADEVADLSDIYKDWILSLGKMPECRTCGNSINSTFDKNYNLDWIKDEKLISKELSTILVKIKDNRNLGNQYYVGTTGAGNAYPKNEKKYIGDNFPNRQQRLLGFFRFWNFIEYFYPYKYMLDSNWDSILKEYIPKINAAANEKEYHLIISELIGNIDDSHTRVNFLSDSNQVKHFPYTVKDVEGECVIVGSYNAKIGAENGLMVGDIIVEVNGKNVQKYFQSNENLLSASNHAFKKVKAYTDLLNGDLDSQKLRINRSGKILEMTVKLYKFQDFDYYNTNYFPSHSFIRSDVGYINIRTLPKDKKLISKIMSEMADSKAIIFDVRGYPQNTHLLLGEELNSEEQVFAYSIAPDLSYPGKFIYLNESKVGKKNKRNFKGLVIILVDESTFSLGEFTVMSLQTLQNNVTVGSQTAGADGNVSHIEYFGGHKVQVSGLGIFYPDGRETQRKGIKIDHIVNLTIDGVRSGRDEILGSALNLISKE